MTSQPGPRSTTPCRDEWLDIGLGADLRDQCLCHGWTLYDVCEVLCTDQPAPITAECLRLGVDPLEVLADLKATTSAPDGKPPTEQP